MGLRERLEKLERAADPDGEPLTFVIMPDNYRDNLPSGLYGRVLQLPPEHKYWDTSDFADIEPDYLRPRNQSGQFVDGGPPSHKGDDTR